MEQSILPVISSPAVRTAKEVHGSASWTWPLGLEKEVKGLKGNSSW